MPVNPADREKARRAVRRKGRSPEKGHKRGGVEKEGLRKVGTWLLEEVQIKTRRRES